MSLKFSSRSMLNNLQEAARKLAGKTSSARITVPEDVGWWYYQEFGTASKQDTESPDIPGVVQADIPATSHPGGYDIHAKYADFIRLPVTSRYPEEWVAPYVHHPGVSPKAYIRRILPEIRNQSVPVIVRALIDSGFSLDVVQDALMGEIMPQVLDEIAESMSIHLNSSPDRDRGGKLDFQDPATVFKDSAHIIDSRAE